MTSKDLGLVTGPDILHISFLLLGVVITSKLSRRIQSELNKLKQDGMVVQGLDTVFVR
jgi:hypothetical protein